jgi:hypothetical protein
MVKIRKKLNAVLFESSLDTTWWFLIGLIIALFIMFTIISLGFGAMFTNMILGALGMLFDQFIPLLEGWGNSLVGIMESMFPAEVNQAVGVVVCVAIAAAILVLFTLLAIKKPEKMRLLENNGNF